MTLTKLSCLFGGGPVTVDQTRLAKLAGVQRSTVTDSTKRLQDVGIITIQRAKVGKTSTYTVNHEALARAAQASPVLNGGAPSAA